MRIFVYMTTLAIEIPENQLERLSAILKKIGGNIIDDGGFTAAELSSIERGLKEAIDIKNGKSQPLSMSDLWDE